MRLLIGLFLLFPIGVFSQKKLPDVPLRAGMTITSSCRVVGSSEALIFVSGDSTLVTVRGQDIEVDFGNLTLLTTADPKRPDRFVGTGIRVEGHDIRIRNVRVQGVRVGLYARDCNGLRVENCDFSYNFRPGRAAERARVLRYNPPSVHHWPSAGLLLVDCDSATIKNCEVSGGQHGLLMQGCDHGLVFNNYFTFNSGVGIGLYRSTYNRIQHNHVDWNAGRGAVPPATGYASGGIFCEAQSQHNVVAYNSATHCDYGCRVRGATDGHDDNLIFGNDVSCCVGAGVDLWRSNSRVSGNLIRDCAVGISNYANRGTEVSGNWIAECAAGVLVTDAAQKNTVRQNLFSDDTIGIRVIEKTTLDPPATLPIDRSVRIDRNVFLNTYTPLAVAHARQVVVNGENLFFDFEKLVDLVPPVDSLVFLRNDVYGTPAELADIWRTPHLTRQRTLNFEHSTDAPPDNPYAPLEMAVSELREPDSLPGGLLAVLPPEQSHGRVHIHLGQWGPYDFKRPIGVLSASGTVQLIGPPGDWRIKTMRGVHSTTAQRGIGPTKFDIQPTTTLEQVFIEIEYNSPEVIITEFGEKLPPGKIYLFEIKRD
jgi:nitrous oxidase accessory protein NosD